VNKVILLGLVTTILITGIGGSLQYASATVFFSDNFDSENGGVGVFNYNGFANWSVSDGTVDLVGNGFEDFLPGNGLYLDMDGSTVDAGKITSNPITVLGWCTLQYELAGNQRKLPDDQVIVKINDGAILDVIQSLDIFDPFTLFTHDFHVDVPTPITLSFEGTGFDNEGMHLDDVVVSCVNPVGGEIIPLDSTMVLLAGSQYTAAWMIPVLVSGIGIAIVIARKF